MTSAAEQHVVGCPLPASDVDLTESIRSRVATFLSAGMRAERSRGIEIADCRSRIAEFKHGLTFAAASP